VDGSAELRALAGVQARLEARFPDLDVEVVEAAVRVAHSELTGHVRDFVPVLVEHAARDRLSFALRGADGRATRPGRESDGASDA
jgi:hypothetical protein